VRLKAGDKIMIQTFEGQVSNTEDKIYLTSLFVVCGLTLLPSELFLIVISCK